jgi:hypothetical protein
MSSPARAAISRLVPPGVLVLCFPWIACIEHLHITNNNQADLVIDFFHCLYVDVGGSLSLDRKDAATSAHGGSQQAMGEGQSTSGAGS